MGKMIVFYGDIKDEFNKWLDDNEGSVKVLSWQVVAEKAGISARIYVYYEKIPNTEIRHLSREYNPKDFEYNSETFKREYMCNMREIDG